MYSTVQYKILYMLQERIRLLVIHICTRQVQHNTDQENKKSKIPFPIYTASTVWENKKSKMPFPIYTASTVWENKKLNAISYIAAQ